MQWFVSDGKLCTDCSSWNETENAREQQVCLFIRVGGGVSESSTEPETRMNIFFLGRWRAGKIKIFKAENKILPGNLLLCYHKNGVETNKILKINLLKINDHD